VKAEVVRVIALTSFRPRAAALQHVDLRVEQLVGHGDLAHLGLEALDLLVPGVPFALPRSTFCREERQVAPF